MSHVTHAFVTGKADGTDATLVKPSNWNADHVMTTDADGVVLGRTAGAGAGAVQELPFGAVLPYGTVLPFAGPTAPTGWLICDGSSLLRSDYLSLFNVIGTFYGTVDGAHFNIPDLRGRTIAGLDPTGTRLTSSISPNGNTLGGVGGEQSHTLSTAEMPAHNHPVTYTGGGVLIWTRQSINFTGPPAADFDGLTISTSNTGGGGAHNNVQPTLLMNWIIKT